MSKHPEITDLLIQMNEARYPIKAMSEQYGVCRVWLKREIDRLRKRGLIQSGSGKPKRQVIGVSDDAEIRFESISEAGRQGFDSNHICDCLNGRRLSHAGYRWSEVA